jgi:Cu/Ag efflux protein CusF
MRDVALRFAVKPEKILRKNGMKEGDRISKGQVLWLR